MGAWVLINDRWYYTFEGLDDVGAPLIIRSKAEYKNTAALKSLKTYKKFDGWLIKELLKAQTENENHDYRFWGTYYRSEVIGILPVGFSVPYTGPKLHFVSEFGSLHRSYRISDGGYRIVTELSMPSGTISLDKIPAFNKFLKYLRLNSNTWVALKHSPAE